MRFEEKPKTPETTLISTICYIFPKETGEDIEEYVRGAENKDMPGLFIKWLSKRTDVYGFVFDEFWFDIGSPDLLEKAERFMSELQKRR